MSTICAHCEATAQIGIREGQGREGQVLLLAHCLFTNRNLELAATTTQHLCVPARYIVSIQGEESPEAQFDSDAAHSPQVSGLALLEADVLCVQHARCVCAG